MYRIHHLGYIVKNISDYSKLMSCFGYYPFTRTIYDDIQHNNILFMKSEDDHLIIELIEPADNNSSIYNFKPGYHHVCYEVNMGYEFIEIFKKMKIGRLFTDVIVAPALDGRKVIFGCLRDGQFVEFLLKSGV